jgi:hypothetical protein
LQRTQPLVLEDGAWCRTRQEKAKESIKRPISESGREARFRAQPQVKWQEKAAVSPRVR